MGRESPVPEPPLPRPQLLCWDPFAATNWTHRPFEWGVFIATVLSVLGLAILPV